jgi:hypothetical protein
MDLLCFSPVFKDAHVQINGTYGVHEGAPFLYLLCVVEFLEGALIYYLLFVFIKVRHSPFNNA